MNTTPRRPVAGLETYFGGKGHPATVRRIINAMPPHRVYIEPFVGGGAVLRTKKAAPCGDYGIEKDPAVFQRWMDAGYPVRLGDAFDLLPQLLAQVSAEGVAAGDVLVYVDAPYIIEARRNPVSAYGCEFAHSDHARLLAMVAALPCMVMVSHLPHPLYANALATWHTFTFGNHTHNGIQTEQVWCNFTPTEHLHDTRFIGGNFRERERIKRSLGVIRRRLAALPPEAQAAFQGFLQTNGRT